MRAPLSVTIISLNEEQNIRACLESVQWADEIVVCDSGSRDKTLEICREYTDRVFVDAWRGFGAHKNLCLDRTSHPWILSLDADERVTAGLRRAIQAILAGNGAADGYYVPRQNFFLGRWMRSSGWYPDHVLRLFKKARGRFKERAVHESVEVDGKVEYLQEPLEHHTYRTISDYLERMDRYSGLAAEELHRAGRRAGLPDLLLRPPFTFLRMYLLRGGFREGWHGLVLAGLYACYTFAKYAKLWDMRRAG
ncbi:MAG TPA: glycosyltransferase family 2 protein [Candidatus Acidoferrum sp.]|nr:glycosyltransferase family 2 protein [Candidatus Acidoferrum sp.]